MKQISSIDLYFLTRELKILENQRIDNFYYDNETFYIKVYIKQKGNLYLTNKISKYIYLDNKKHDTTHPQNFILFLRKYLKNTYIELIEQIEAERILKLKISKKEEDGNFSYYYLFLELFSNGNIVLTDEELNIKNSLIKKTFKDRTIKVHQKYELPPQKDITIFKLKDQYFKTLLENSELSIVKFLATKLGMGGKFSEETCAQAGLDKNKKELSSDELDALSEFLKELPHKEIKPFGIYKNNEIKDFIPFDFISINDEKREFNSFNELLKTYYEQFDITEDKREKEFEKELEKLQRRLRTQEESLEKTYKEYERYNEIGNKIYENYALVEDLLNSINTAAKEKGWEHVQDVIKENEKLNKVVKKLNYKNNEIILNLD